MNRMRSLLMPAFTAVALSGYAFGTSGENGVAFHGSVQADVLFPEEDKEIGTDKI